MFAITRAERRWVLWIALSVALVTSLPYLAAAASQGPLWRFTGFVFGVEDGNSYIAKMLSGAQGAWLLRLPYTALPQNGVLAHLPYLLLGKLSAPPGQHEQLVALFHLFRVAGIFLYCLATYDFLAWFLPGLWLRRAGLALAALGGGIGWLVVTLGLNERLLTWIGGAAPGLDQPLAFYSPETFGFLMLYGIPHLAVGRALLLWGVRAVLSGASWLPAEKVLARLPLKIPIGGVTAGLCFLGLGLLQPLTVVSAWAILGAFAAAVVLVTRRWAALREPPYLERILWAGAISAPLVIYTTVAFSLDPAASRWASQNQILSPNPVFYLLAFGLWLPFAVLGAWRLWRSVGVPGLLPAAWVIVFPFLAYFPYNLQRRLPEGVWVAWIVLALASVAGYAGQDVVKHTRKMSLAVVGTASLGTAFILLVGGLISSFQTQIPQFRPADETAAFSWLGQEAPPGSVVLAAYPTGNALPAWAPLRVLVGHGPESIDLATLQPRVEAFFGSEAADEERRALLDEFAVAYVFWGPGEKALGNWDPRTADFLEEAARFGEYQVFRVLR